MESRSLILCTLLYEAQPCANPATLVTKEDVTESAAGSVGERWVSKQILGCFCSRCFHSNWVSLGGKTPQYVYMGAPCRRPLSLSVFILLFCYCVYGALAVEKGLPP